MVNLFDFGETVIAGKKISKEVMRELLHAHERVENASRGGCSDWDGGGNPHRMMEDMEREFAWKDFCDLCASHGLEAYQVREELSK